ncbi:MAG: hypothetical protein IPM06_19550 [Rhizobiales bacterium]|nr:hypothetical protein [Hyphomicrobiales bacterium]
MSYTLEDLQKSYLAGGSVHSHPRVLATPYLHSIAEGNIVGHKAWSLNGFTAAGTTAESDVWTVGGPYVFPTAGMGMEVVSTDNTQDKSAGSGALTVVIDYLNHIHEQMSETIALNGTTVVPTVGTDIFRVQSFRLGSAGIGGKAVGTISLRHLSDTPVYASIAPGYTKDRDAIWTVPTGKVVYITSVAVSGLNAGADKGVRFTLRSTSDADGIATGGFFIPHFEIALRNGAFERTFDMPLRFSEHVDLKMSVIAEASATTCICGLRGWMESE